MIVVMFRIVLYFTMMNERLILFKCFSAVLFITLYSILRYQRCSLLVNCKHVNFNPYLYIIAS